MRSVPRRLLANGLILAALRQWRPEDGILSEESRDGPDRLGRARVWIVDPLDGTREYVDGRDDWRSTSRSRSTASPRARWRCDPRPRFRTDEPAPPPLELKRAPRMVVSRSGRRKRPGRWPLRSVQSCADGLGRRQGDGRGRGRGGLYFHAGGQHEWDNCAPVAVALAAGLHVSRRDGSALLYNRERPFVPDLLICRADLAARAWRRLRSLATVGGELPRRQIGPEWWCRARARMRSFAQFGRHRPRRRACCPAQAGAVGAQPADQSVPGCRRRWCGGRRR